MGVKNGLADPEFRRFVGDAVAKCAKAGIITGSFQYSVPDACWFLECGGCFVSLGSDMRSIAQAAQADLAAMADVRHSS